MAVNLVLPAIGAASAIADTHPLLPEKVWLAILISQRIRHKLSIAVEVASSRHVIGPVGRFHPHRPAVLSGRHEITV